MRGPRSVIENAAILEDSNSLSADIVTCARTYPRKVATVSNHDDVAPRGMTRHEANYGTGSCIQSGRLRHDRI